MDRKILLTVSYDGTNYHGWQRQNDSNVPTVELSLENSLREVFKSKDIVCMGASRTDKAVHAFAQKVTFKADTNIPIEKIPMVINNSLPYDIVATDAVEVSEDFHVRYDVVSKTYEYKILNQKYRNPKERNYSAFVRDKLNLLDMQKASKALLGTHDFKAFSATGSSVKTSIRTIFDIEVKAEDSFIFITVTGNGFLYNMVRIIAGTLIYVGMGKINYSDMQNIIESGDRTKAGKTSPPQGLTLLEIKYR